MKRGHGESGGACQRRKGRLGRPFSYARICELAQAETGQGSRLRSLVAKPPAKGSWAQTGAAHSHSLVTSELHRRVHAPDFALDKANDFFRKFPCFRLAADALGSAQQKMQDLSLIEYGAE